MPLFPHGAQWQTGRQSGGYRKLLLALGATWDAWLLHFPPGAAVAPHTDPVAGADHHRVNLVLWRPARGGAYVGEALFRLGRLIYFRPDIMIHAVTPCATHRVVLSVGWIRPSPNLSF